MRIKFSDLREVFIYLFAFLAIMPGYLQIAGHNITSMLTPLLMLAYMVFDGKLKLHKFSGTEAPILLFWLLRIISYVINGEYFTAIAFTVFILFARQLVYDYVKDTVTLENVIDIILNVSVVLGILGIIEAVTEQNLFLLLNNSGEIITRNDRRLGFIRIISFTTQTSHYALYCCICLLLSLYLYYTRGQKKRYRNIIIILLVNLFFTGTRIAILVMVGCYALIVFRRGVSTFLKRSLLILLGVIIILLFMNQTFIGQFLIMFLSQIIPGLEKLMKSGAVASAEQSNIIGTRLQLYSWVFSSMDGHWLTGFGEKVQFAYNYIVSYMGNSWTQTKENIEVNYLSMLYHYGIIGCIGESFMMIWYSIKSLKTSIIEKRVYGEMKFAAYFHYILLFILLCWFGTMVGEERFTFYIILYLYVRYERDKIEY